MRIVLVLTYELGHQPFGLASPKAWLLRAGHEVTSVDLAKIPLSENAIRQAGAIAFSLPMHTATRLAIPVIERVKRVNPVARIACYGLYAPLNAELLRSLGVEAILGGEFEEALVRWVGGEKVPEISLDKLEFVKPDRSDGGASYAQLRTGAESKVVAYTEASRGCKHRCRHCPVVPVYQGQFRVVQRDVVLDDIRQQIDQGASHVTFGDPDFFNGPTHAMRIVEQLHAEFPPVTRQRHARALAEALAQLDRGARALETPELAAEDLRLAARALQRITGRIGAEDVLDVIFASFAPGIVSASRTA